MSIRQYQLTDRITVPAALAAAHSTLPQQSIYVLRDTCSEELKLIRLLLGNVKISYVSGASWVQARNFSRIGAPRVNFRTHKYIDRLLAPHSLTPADIDKHLRSTLPQRLYYGQLLAEALHFLRRTKENQHTIAFLHLYRFLEHISFAFPLLYAARTTNFSNAYTALRDFFGNNTRGELKFFEKFVESAIDSPIRQQTIKILFHTVDPAYIAKVFSNIERQLDENSIISTIADTEIEIRCQTLSGLCINLRNRFFHFLATDPTNISLNEIGEPDSLFECVNDHIFNWLAVLFFETLKHRVHATI